MRACDSFVAGKGVATFSFIAALFLAALSGFTQGTLTSPCRTGWTGYRGNCYKVFNESANNIYHTQSETFCQTQGAYLVNIEDQAENDFVSTMVLGHNLANVFVSIGLQEEKNRNTFNVWRWYPSGRLPTFTQWAGGDVMGENRYAYLVVGSDPRLSVWRSSHNVRAKFMCETGCGSPLSSGAAENVQVTGNTSFSGAAVTYSCPPKHYLLGRAQRICQGDSLWSEEEPECTDSTACPDGWLQYDTNCYRVFSDVSRSWDEAQAACSSSNGAYLLNIADQAENLLIGKILYTQNLLSTQFWIGLSEERLFSTNGDWRWRPRGNALLPGFEAWAPSEPQNLYPWDCATVKLSVDSFSQPEWYDFRCDESKPFICERGCHEPDGINPDLVQTNGNSTGVDSSLTYRCSDGYEIVGDTTIVCLHGGHWDATQIPTCEPARGARTLCNDTHMTVAVGKFDLAGFNPSSIHLLDSQCTFQQNSSHYFATTLLDGGCNTSRIVTKDQVEYRNRVLYNTGAVNISVSCYIRSTANLSLEIALERRVPVTMTASPGTQQYDISFKAFNDSSYRFPYQRSIFPTPLFTTDHLFMSAAVKTSDRHVTGLRASQCWATPGDQQAQPQVVFLDDGCPTADGDVLLYKTTDGKSNNFSVAIGNQIGDTFANSLFYLHCTVRVCQSDDAQSICTTTCTGDGSTVRRKRAAEGDMSDQLSHVFVGPFRVDSHGQAAHNSKGETSSSTVWVMIATSTALVAMASVAAVVYRRRKRSSSARRRAMAGQCHQRNNSAGDVIYNEFDAESTCDELGEFGGAAAARSSDTISIGTQMTLIDDLQHCDHLSWKLAAEQDCEDVF
ncbi:uncharacterized protein LOC135810011 [Sycon ciliatum]|uniref:uncharacterized protein LOC135810011 n=2 Tax=Sycon ciliatum TaxID=27933 RepID=UPI0031F71BD6